MKMSRLIFSVIISLFFAVLTGVSLAYCLSDTPIHHHDTMPLLWPIILSAHFYALVLNCIFYFMNHWGHFHLKRQGLVVTISTFIVVAAPVYFLYQFLSPEFQQLVGQYEFALLGQFAVIGFVGTYLLKIRTERLPV